MSRSRQEARPGAVRCDRVGRWPGSRGEGLEGRTVLPRSRRSSVVFENGAVTVDSSHRDQGGALHVGHVALDAAEHRGRCVQGFRAQARNHRRRLPCSRSGQEPEAGARLQPRRGLSRSPPTSRSPRRSRRKSSSRVSTSGSVGQIAAEIRAYRPPEPYKGKGVRYSDEFIFRKEGKKK